MDIVTYNAAPYKPYIFENQNAQNNYLKLSLEGTMSNKNAVGTKILVHFGGNTIMRYVHVGEGYLNQNSYFQHVGIGTSTTIDSVELFWLSGTRDVFHNIEANQFLYIKEGSSNTISQPCLVTTLVQDPVSSDTSIVMAKSIITKSLVTQATLDLTAGNVIIFGEGFELDENSELSANIDSCN